MSALQDFISKLEKDLQTRLQVGVFDTPRDGGKSNAEVAAYMEYGTDSVPARPFLQPGIREFAPRLAGYVAQAVNASMNGQSPDPIMASAGQNAANTIRGYVQANNIAPSLAEATVQAKGHDHALIDTEQLIHAIDFEVTK